MSGLIQRSEYDRVVRERDALADEVAYLRSELIDRTDPRILAYRAVFGVAPIRASVLAALVDAPGSLNSRQVMAKVGCSSDKSVHVHIHRINRALEAKGCPSRPILNPGFAGYRLTPEARAWLSQAIQPQAEGRSP